MSGTGTGNIFTIPPGLPFLKTFAARLLDGTILPDFVYDPARPLDLAEATIFLPTRRAVRVLRSEFVDLLGGRSAILPTIRALGETDEDAAISMPIFRRPSTSRHPSAVPRGSSSWRA